MMHDFQVHLSSGGACMCGYSSVGFSSLMRGGKSKIIACGRESRWGVCEFGGTNGVQLVIAKTI